MLQGPLGCNGVADGIVSFNWNENCSYLKAPNIHKDLRILALDQHQKSLLKVPPKAIPIIECEKLVHRNPGGLS